MKMGYDIETTQYAELSPKCRSMAIEHGEPHAIESTQYGLHITRDLTHALVIWYPTGEAQYIQ